MLCTLPSDEKTSLGLSFCSFIILTGFVNIDPRLKRIIHLFVSSELCVPSFLVTNELHILKTFSSTKKERSKLLRILSRTKPF